MGKPSGFAGCSVGTPAGKVVGERTAGATVPGACVPPPTGLAVVPVTGLAVGSPTAGLVVSVVGVGLPSTGPLDGDFVSVVGVLEGADDGEFSPGGTVCTVDGNKDSAWTRELGDRVGTCEGNSNES